MVSSAYRRTFAWISLPGSIIKTENRKVQDPNSEDRMTEDTNKNNVEEDKTKLHTKGDLKVAKESNKFNIH